MARTSVAKMFSSPITSYRWERWSTSITLSERSAKATNKGYYFEPTVLTEVPDDSRIMREEPFGPLAPIVTYRDLDDAIERANSTPFGLAAYGFTASQSKAEALSHGLHAGMVGINTFMIAHAEAPFGGVDHSGMGREGGRQAIHDYMNVKLTHLMPV